MILTLDFETKDPYIDRGLGGGWCYPKGDFRVLGASVLAAGKGHVLAHEYSDIDRLGLLPDRINQVTELIMHNASYDLGCLKCLGIEVPKHVKIVDTMVMAKLFDNSLGLGEYNLDALSQRYLGKKKDNKLLADTVYKLDLLPYTKTQEKEKLKGIERKRPDDKELIKWAKANMDILQEKAPEVVAKYANTDTQNTYELYCYFRDAGIDMNLVYKYSQLARIVTDYRAKGVRIDLDAANYVKRMLDIEIIAKFEAVYRLAAEEFNVSSPIDVARVLETAGLELPVTGKGNKSATGPWLEKQNHPLCQAIVDARKVLKMKNDFVQKIIDMQEFTCPGATKYGRIYPQLNLLEATTGRFSCSNPNVQQIPSRDSKYSALIKAMFVPEEGELWFELDYSNQEGRLQIHYASLFNCDGASEFRLRFQNNPEFDMHQKIADMVGISRQEAKTINLGLSYGMGVGKLQNALGASKNAKVLKDRYNEYVPFLSQLNQHCQNAMKQRGYVRTLGRRQVRIDKPTMIDGERKTFEYTALNRLIQGSAADQTIEAMLRAYDEGLPVLFPIHDAVCISGTKEQAMRMKEIMESCCKLEVPVVASMKEEGGNNWAEAAH